VCLARTTDAIGPSLRWGDGNSGDGCVISKIDIYRRFVNLLWLRVFSSQLIGNFALFYVARQGRTQSRAISGMMHLSPEFWNSKRCFPCFKTFNVKRPIRLFAIALGNERDLGRHAGGLFRRLTLPQTRQPLSSCKDYFNWLIIGFCRRRVVLTYEMPKFFAPAIAGGKTYDKWLKKRARALRKHDRNRENHPHTAASYEAALHTAMKRSGGVDEYSGEPIDWSLAFRNGILSKGAKHRRKFAAAPSLDHVTGGGLLIAICRDDTNTAKGCMTVSDFYAFCATIAGGPRPFI
jgi:hypothetical protein